jgi:hypothetical protein
MIYNSYNYIIALKGYREFCNKVDIYCG